MKLKLDDVRKAFTVVDTVKASPVCDSSQFVRIRQAGTELTLGMTGILWAEARAAGEGTGKWTAYAERRAFKAFMSTAAGEDLEFFYKDKLVLRAGGQRLEVAPHSTISGYETWAPKAAIELNDEQKHTLKMMTRYLPNIAGSEHVEAVLFEKDYGMIVTNTVFIVALLGTACPQTFVPSAVAEVLAQGGKLAWDKSGVGVVQDTGFIYQPLSADLDRFPKDKCREVIGNGLKAAACFRTKASDLAKVLTVANQFLVDKAETATIAPGKTGLTITVDMTGGKFQRNVATVGDVKLKVPVQWPVRKVLPWLEYAGDAEIEYALMPGANILRYADGKLKAVVVFAEV